MQAAVLPKLLLQILRANRRAGLIYLNNPKAGCSSVKLAMWAHIRKCDPRDIRDVHDFEASPFGNRIAALGWAENAKVFTFVRNPFTRIVSAYLNKIVKKRDNTFHFLAQTYGLSLEDEISFDAFVEMISGSVTEWLDPHWRPQQLNTMAPFVTPNFLGHLETMDEQFTLLSNYAFGTALKTSPGGRAHRTNANDTVLEYMKDPATLRRIQDLYGPDFELFGYPDRPEFGIAPEKSCELSTHTHPQLAKLATYFATRGPARFGILDELEAGPGGESLSNWALFERVKAARTQKALRPLQEAFDRHSAGPESVPRYLQEALGEAVRRTSRAG